MKKILIAVAIITVVLLFLYIRRERYEEPPQTQAPEVPQADLNPAIEALKNEISACGEDKACVRNALVNSMKIK